MIYLDITHASHSHAQTGIQQVARGLWKELAKTGEVEGVAYDKYARSWRRLDSRERRHLDEVDRRDDARRKRAHWSAWQRLRGRTVHLLAPLLENQALPPGDALIVPEFYDDNVRRALPSIRDLVHRRDVAIFHDAIAFEHPHWGVPDTIKRFPEYLASLAKFSAVACVSEYSRRQLLRSWETLGIRSDARVEAIPLGLRIDHLGPRPAKTPPPTLDRPLRLLCVSTIEPRKNQMVLLEAAESLWAQGHRFELRFIGMLNRGFPTDFPQRVDALQKAGRPVFWDGSLSATSLQRAYLAADLTVYPSSSEGFGLPVYESLYYHTPVITTAKGALAEIPRGSGCLQVDPTGPALREAILAVLTHHDRRRGLAREAAAVPLRTLADYASDLMRLLKTL